MKENPLIGGFRRTARFMQAFAADPGEISMKVRDRLVERWEQRTGRSGGMVGGASCPYRGEQDWERRLHELVGEPFPCEAVSEFEDLWPEVVESMRRKGVSMGRGAFGGWGDGEPGLVRAVWCLTRHLRPEHVVETGVARGLTTRFILEALERNGSGHLWSIDLPPQLKPELHAQIGMAVTEGLRHRWTYIKGSSRRCLPPLLSELGMVDLFIHDSRHTEDNLRFEMGRVWPKLREGGVIVADDIDLNWGFASFTRACPGHSSVIAYGEPLQADPERYEGKGLIGILRKNPV